MSIVGLTLGILLSAMCFACAQQGQARHGEDGERSAVPAAEQRVQRRLQEGARRVAEAAAAGGAPPPTAADGSAGQVAACIPSSSASTTSASNVRSIPTALSSSSASPSASLVGVARAPRFGVTRFDELAVGPARRRRRPRRRGAALRRRAVARHRRRPVAADASGPGLLRRPRRRRCGGVGLLPRLAHLARRRRRRRRARAGARSRHRARRLLPRRLLLRARRRRQVPARGARSPAPGATRCSSTKRPGWSFSPIVTALLPRRRAGAIFVVYVAGYALLRLVRRALARRRLRARRRRPRGVDVAADRARRARRQRRRLVSFRYEKRSELMEERAPAQLRQEPLLRPHPRAAGGALSDAATEERESLALILDAVSQVRRTPRSTRARSTKRRALPPAVLEGMRELGLFGLAIPEAYGGARPVGDRLRARHAGGRRRRRLGRGHARRPSVDRLQGPGALRQRRAEAALPAAPGHRRAHRRVRPDRAGLGLRRGLDQDARGRRGRRQLRPRRQQDLDHQRRHRRLLHRLRADRGRARRRAQGSHHRVPRRARLRRQVRPRGAQARHQGLVDDRALLRRRARARGERARHRRRRLQGGDGHPQQRATRPRPPAPSARRSR